MKRILLPFSSLLLAMFMLAACADTNEDNEAEENSSEEQKETEANDTGDENKADEKDETDMDIDEASDEQSEMQQQMEKLDYKEFELEVKYEGDKEYEAEIELDHDQYTAELEDELIGIEIEGKEAFDEIYPLLADLEVTKEMDKDEVIKQSLQAFNLDEDYTKFELEITFNDDVELEFEDK